MLRIFLFLIIGAIAFVLFRLIRIGRAIRSAERSQGGGGVDSPPDASYRNIEEADFEDLSSRPTPPDNQPPS